jgi:6-phosphofructokinase
VRLIELILRFSKVVITSKIAVWSVRLLSHFYQSLINNTISSIHVSIEFESFALLLELKDQLDQSHFEPLANQCKKFGITGLVIVGATHTLTDCIKISEYFKTNKIDTNVINIPSTIDANIRHNYF